MFLQRLVARNLIGLALGELGLGGAPFAVIASCKQVAAPFSQRR